jgi:hypothetical protein
VAPKQARAMSFTGSVSHSADGSFESRLGKLRMSRAAENIGAGYPSFSEMLRQWEDSLGHRQNLLIAGAHRIGVVFVANARSPYRKFWAMVITDWPSVRFALGAERLFRSLISWHTHLFGLLHQLLPGREMATMNGDPG